MGGKRTLARAVEHPPTSALRVCLPRSITIGTKNTDAVRHLNRTVSPFAAVSCEISMTFVAPRIAKVAFILGCAGYEADRFAIRCINDVSADERGWLHAMLVANAGFVLVVHASTMA